MGGQMAAEDYEQTACAALGLPHWKSITDGAADYIRVGTLTLGETDEVIDSVVSERMAKIDMLLAEGHGEAGFDSKEIRDLYEQHAILSYSGYLRACKEATTIKREHLNMAADEQEMRAISARILEADVPFFGSLGGEAGRKIAEKQRRDWIKEWVGVDPEKVDKDRIKAAKKRFVLEGMYNGVTRRFASEYNPERHTEDRAGYRRYLTDASPELAKLLDRPVPALLSEDDRQRHTYITGGSGSGKSELLKVLVHGYVTNPELGAVVVIDPHGDLVEQIAQWKEFAEGDRVVYVDAHLFTDRVPTLNPIEVDGGTDREKEVRAQELLTCFEQLLKGSGGGELSVNMRALLMPCLMTLFDMKGATLADLLRFMNDEKNDDLVARGKKSSRKVMREFFEDGFTSNSFNRTKQSIAVKLQSLFNSSAFYELVNGKTSIDLEKLVNQRKVILFNLGKGRIGPEASEAFGRFVLAVLQGMAFRRESIPKEDRVPVNIFIDECQNYISPSLGSILAETRKYRLHATLAQQVAGIGMSPEVRTVVLNNTNVKLAGRTPEDRRMADIMKVEQHQVQNLSVGQFWCKMGKSPTFQIKSRTELLDTKNSMSEDEWAAVLKRLEGYYRPKDEDQAPETDAGAAPRPDEDGHQREMI